MISNDACNLDSFLSLACSGLFVQQGVISARQFSFWLQPDPYASSGSLFILGPPNSNYYTGSLTQIGLYGRGGLLWLPAFLSAFPPLLVAYFMLFFYVSLLMFALSFVVLQIMILRSLV